MNIAVISPHAMNAPMLGMTMLDRKVPNFWTLTRAPLLRVAVAVEAIWFPSRNPRT